MNKKLSLLAAAFAACCFSGCEIDRADRAVSIEPGSADVRYGQSVQLKAGGGYFYTWSMEHNDWGRFNTTRGDTVLYTSIYTPSNTDSSLQLITVLSTYTDTSSPSNTSTSQTSYVNSAEAYIRHLP